MRRAATPLAALAVALILALGPHDPGITRDEPIVDLFDVAESATTSPTDFALEATPPIPES